jgi:hypothetical protein
MSNDGEMRVDLKVAVRASRDELAIVLIRGKAPYHVAGEDREELSAAAAERAIKQFLCQWGTEVEGWSDHMEEGQRDEWLEWARRQVDRAYPALAPGGSDGPPGS